jgi:hypothetical protein
MERKEKTARLILLLIAAAAQIGGFVWMGLALGWGGAFAIALFCWGYYLQSVYA